MQILLKSAAMAVFIAAVVLGLAVGVIAPMLPPVAAGPEVDMRKEVRLAPGRALEVRNARGDVHVRVQDVKDIQATARLRVYSRQRGAAQQARAYAAAAIHAAPSPDDPDCAVITSDTANRPDALEAYVDYHIIAPRGVEVRVTSRNGNISLSGPLGSVRVRGCNNDVRVRDARGHVDVRTSNGRIRVVNARAGATLVTLNGNIYAHMRGGTLEAETTNGLIVAHVRDTAVQACRLTSRNGGITVALKDGCDAEVDAATEFGTIRADIPLAGKTEARGLRVLKTSPPAPSTRLELGTLNGNITIARSGP
jgi:hypothetical protein